MFIYLVMMLLFGFTSQQAHEPENTFDTCSLKLDRGNACCRKPNNTIRYFFDPKLERCFSYLYEGCDGGRNTFYTQSECEFTCIPADKFVCGGNMEPTGFCRERDRSCPAGSKCIIGFVAGLCCDIANEEAWYQETHPVCQVGSLLKQNREWGLSPVIGKNCAHRFCPYGYDCIQGKRVAHCCGPVSNFKEKFYPEDEDSIDGNLHANEIFTPTKHKP